MRRLRLLARRSRKAVIRSCRLTGVVQTAAPGRVRQFVNVRSWRWRHSSWPSAPLTAERRLRGFGYGARRAWLCRLGPGSGSSQRRLKSTGTAGAGRPRAFV